MMQEVDWLLKKKSKQSNQTCSGRKRVITMRKQEDEEKRWEDVAERERDTSYGKGVSRPADGRRSVEKPYYPFRVHL